MAEPVFIRALRDPRAYPHDCGEIKLVETHISWVFLTGTYAYKLKKPVDFGFLDFSTLGKRRYYCAEECRCNAPFAPELYVGVVAITQDEAGEVCVGGAGKLVDYAVKMRQFAAENQLDILLGNGRLTEQMLREFAKDLAAIYSKLPRILDDPTIDPNGAILHPVYENFRALESADAAQNYRPSLARLRRWTADTYEKHSDIFAERMTGDWIRERHGDLHLSNLVLTENGIRAFDCIEFSEELRRIDAVNDIAFLFMDCAVRSRSDLGYAFLDAYLDASGDYSGSRLLRFYAVYRSLVRAKVAALQLGQSFDESVAARLATHIEWANRVTNSSAGQLTLMCGVSGSGKSWLAERLVPHLAAIRLRSDIVRRQLGGLDRTQNSGSTLNCGLYNSATGEAVYQRLRDLSADLLAGGENVIVDATFLTRSNRAAFQALAELHGRRCVVVVCEAASDVLRQRVVERLATREDPSEATPAVLDRQLELFEATGPDERSVRVRTDQGFDPAAIAAELNLR